MTTEHPSPSEQVIGAARALFRERRTLSVDDIRTYLKQVAQVHLSEIEVEETVNHLLSGHAGNLPAIALHQAFVFKRAARGFWHGQYSILVVEATYQLPSPTATSGTGRGIYFTFGIADDEEATEKFLGAASNPEAVLKLLQQEGIEIDGWFPLAAEQWKALLHTTKDLKTIVEKFGPSVYSAAGTTTCPFVGGC
jgi:hypothetical protein